MHLPDHYLDPTTCAVTGAVAAGAVAYGVTKLRAETTRERLPYVAATTAAIFAAQMVNYPVAQGTSGHLVGGALAALLLGPWTAVVAMTVILVIQAVVFGDGGLAALGANIVNMAVATPLAAVAVDRLLSQAGLGRSFVRAGIAAWASVMVAALLCSFELAFAGEQTLSAVLTGMLGIHAVIGASEALVTAAVILAIGLAVPCSAGLRVDSTPAAMDARRATFVALAIALLVGVLASPWGSALPDGLEAAASELGFADATNGSFAVLPEYSTPGANGVLSTSIAGLAGIALAFGGSLLVTRTSLVGAGWAIGRIDSRR